MFCTATPDISSLSENMNSIFPFLMAMVYTLELVNDVLCIFPLIQVKYMSKFFVHSLYSKFTQPSEFIFRRVY